MKAVATIIAVAEMITVEIEIITVTTTVGTEEITTAITTIVMDVMKTAEMEEIITEMITVAAVTTVTTTVAAEEIIIVITTTVAGVMIIAEITVTITVTEMTEETGLLWEILRLTQRKQETVKKTVMILIVSTAATIKRITEMKIVVERITAAIIATMILADRESRRTIRNSSRLLYSHQNRKSQRKM